MCTRNGALIGKNRRRARSFGGPFCWFPVAGKGGQGDPGGVEKLVAHRSRDGLDEDAVGGAGDEIPDALVAVQNGHGVAVGLAGVVGGKDGVVLASI